MGGGSRFYFLSKNTKRDYEFALSKEGEDQKFTKA